MAIVLKKINYKKRNLIQGKLDFKKSNFRSTKEGRNPNKMDLLTFFLQQPLTQLAPLNHPNYLDVYAFYKYFLEDRNITSSLPSTLSRFLFLPLLDSELYLNIPEEGQFIIVDVLNLANHSQFIAKILHLGNARQSPLMIDLAQILYNFGFITSENVPQQLRFLRREQKIEFITEIFSRIAQDQPENKFLLVAGFRYDSHGYLNLLLQSELSRIPLTDQNLDLTLSHRLNLSVIFGSSTNLGSMEADDLLSLYLLILITNVNPNKILLMSGDRFAFPYAETSPYWDAFIQSYKSYLVYNERLGWSFLSGTEYYHPSLIRSDWLS